MQLSASVKTAGDVVEPVDEDWARNLRRIVQSDVLDVSERPNVSATGSSCVRPRPLTSVAPRPGDRRVTSHLHQQQQRHSFFDTFRVHLATFCIYS